MGILDDLAMGFGFKEKDRDYYDRTEQTMRRTQGDARADQYNKYLGRTESGFEQFSLRRGSQLRHGHRPLCELTSARCATQVPAANPYDARRHACARTTSPDLLAQTLQRRRPPAARNTAAHANSISWVARLFRQYPWRIQANRRRKASCGRRIGRRSSRRRSSSLWRQLLRRQRPHAPK